MDGGMAFLSMLKVDATVALNVSSLVMFVLHHRVFCGLGARRLSSSVCAVLIIRYVYWMRCIRYRYGGMVCVVKSLDVEYHLVSRSRLDQGDRIEDARRWRWPPALVWSVKVTLHAVRNT